MLAELLDWGASLGATTAMLHVETDNAGAIALYEQHGFVTHHTNRYLVGAEGRPPDECCGTASPCSPDCYPARDDREA